MTDSRILLVRLKRVRYLDLEINLYKSYGHRVRYPMIGAYSTRKFTFY